MNRPATTLFLTAAAVTLLVTGCNSQKSAASSPSAVASPKQAVTVAPTATPIASVTAPATTSPAVPATPTVAAVAAGWVMPNLRGSVLQTAQDAIQALTHDAVFFTTSHDATGAGRHQILDRDWQVCTQSVAAGTRFSADTSIDFGVVRVGSETCPA